MKPTQIIGDCELYQGDCLEILPHLGKVDAVVTDPPYGISLVPQRGKTESIANDGRGEAMLLWADTLEALRPVLKDNTAHIFWTRWSEVWTKELLESHMTVKSCLVWVKNNFGIGYYTRPQHEFAWYCHFGKPPRPDAPVSDVWTVPRVQAPVHSCEKPQRLLEMCLELVGGEDVLDPFMGSGTTGVACAKLGRRFIGIELEPKYFDIACKRIEDAYRQPDMFVAPPSDKPTQDNML